MEKSSTCCNWDAACSSLKGGEAAGESAVKWNGWSILQRNFAKRESRDDGLFFKFPTKKKKKKFSRT